MFKKKTFFKKNLIVLNETNKNNCPSLISVALIFIFLGVHVTYHKIKIGSRKS